MADKIIIDETTFDKMTDDKRMLHIVKNCFVDKEIIAILFNNEQPFKEADVYIKNELIATFKNDKFKLWCEEAKKYTCRNNATRITSLFLSDEKPHNVYVLWYQENGQLCMEYHYRTEREKEDKTLTQMPEDDKQFVNGYAFKLMCLWFGISKMTLRKKEKIKKARSFFVGNTTGREKKPNQNYTVHLDKGIQYVYEPSNVHREFTRHCEAWNVRGHYRQYKSGKTIFIHPYTKGKGRLNQKQYFI